MITLHVSKDTAMYENCFSSVSDAINSMADIDEEVIIHIHPGKYYEKIDMQKSNVSLVGESSETCIISFDDYANMIMPDGIKRGTFRSYTLLADGNNITIENLTIENSSSPRSKVGQAVALYADGDKITVRNCRLTSYQDTLFTGPLPKKEKQKGGFTGPKEYAVRKIGHQLFENCYIAGDVDFIFGSAIAFFDNCEIASIYSEELISTQNEVPTYGYATAASTYEGCKYGYVFNNCRFTSTCPDKSVYLGRPWRNFAKTVLINCYLGPHIKDEHFHDWNKVEAHESSFYAEYGSYGEGSSMENLAPFAHKLSDKDLSMYSKDTVMNYQFDETYTPE